MKVLVVLIATFIGLLLNSPASWSDGNKLLTQCDDAERFRATQKFQTHLEAINTGLCLGLVQGVRNTMQFTKKIDGKEISCIPEVISNEQAVRIVTTYLRNNPANLHENEVALVMVAYMKAFPCK